jgi:hypothetical protein
MEMRHIGRQRMMMHTLRECLLLPPIKSTSIVQATNI